MTPTPNRARAIARAVLPAPRAVALAAAMATLLVALASTASRAESGGRHTRLIRSSPPNDTTLASPPRAITLWYSKPVLLRLCRMQLTDAAGTSVTLSPPRLTSDSATAVIADVKATLKPGSYVLTWAATSRDSHAIKGSIRFRVTGSAASD